MDAATNSSVGITAELEQGEGPDESDRDFTGLDPVGWVYDLHRPDEPYEARGVHPSGVGVDRYRTSRELTEQEHDYLQRATYMSLLNLVNPQLLGLFDFEIPVGDSKPWRWNASLNSFMAPSGLSTRLNLMLATSDHQLLVQLHAHQNPSLTLPGLSVELVREPLAIVDGSFFSVGAVAWQQPKSQLFWEERSEFGFSGNFRISAPLFDDVEGYIEGVAKTPGWIAGNVFLGQSVDVQLGLEMMVFQ